MNKGIVGVLSFAAGGAIGFAAANKLMKDKYEQLVQDEIESVKEAFKKNREEKKEPEKPTKEERKSYTERVTALGYTEKKKPASDLVPRVIPPDENGSLEDYEQITLTYYADKVLADDNDRAMDDDEIEETVGKESLTHFGEYEEDSVIVRNDRLKVDYEILLDERTYADVLREHPYLAQ